VLRILLADDDPDMREALTEALRHAGHDVTPVEDGAVAQARLAEEPFDVLLSDVRMPRVSGLALFAHTRRLHPTTDVIMMTSFAEVSDAVAALKQGARDYLTKPFDEGELLVRLSQIEEHRTLRSQLAAAELRLRGDATPIVGASQPIARLLERLDAVASSSAPVLVTGESGTGKELVARRIHERSGRRGAFVSINCAALPETLLEAELFGHEKGAFTGAARKREGLFRAASGGTLLLDEIGEMPLSAQSKLLSVLAEGRVRPVGSDTSVPVDVRVVSATHRDLRARVTEGGFREDLYFRLKGVTLHAPPLRERRADLPLLVAHLLRKHVPEGPLPEVAVEAWRVLTAHPFPGNVRELDHAIRHAVVMSRGGRIDPEHFPDDLMVATTPAAPERSVRPLAAVLKDAERSHLLTALAITDGRRARAADLLGISRKNLWEKLRAHGIDDGDGDE
jgi:DNA-binding NtrC family response regulator